MTDTDNVSDGKRICITGGGGYFGQCVANELLSYGHQVVLLDIMFLKTDAVNVLDHPNVQKIKGSVLDKDSLNAGLKDCDACVHIAAYGMSGSASLNRSMCYAVNVVGTRNVVDCCIDNSVPRLIFASSVGVVFTNKEIINGKEDELQYIPAVKHNQFYTPTKMISERHVLSMDGTNLSKPNQKSGESQLHTCALRFRGIFGPGEPRTTFRTAEMCRKGLMMVRFSQRDKCLTQYSGATNCARAFRLAELALGPENDHKACGQAYFIVDGGDPVDSFEFFRPLLNSMGVTFPTWRMPFILMYFFGFVMEVLYHLIGAEPVFTRLEVNLIGVTNYYSIEKARRDLNYNPTDNHDLGPSIEYFKRYYAQKAEQQAANRSYSEFQWLIVFSIASTIISFVSFVYWYYFLFE